MFCPNCGKECDATKPFCQNCGTKLNNNAPAQPYSPNFSAPYLSPTYTKLKELACSSVCMTAVIAFTVYLVLTFISSTTGFGSLTGVFLNVLEPVLGELDLEVQEYLYMFLNNIAQPSIVSVISSMAPQILYCIGMWLVVTSARKGTPKTTGLTIIKVLLIIALVVTCLGFAIALITEIIGMLSVASLDGSGAGAIIFGVILLVTAIVAFLCIMYYAKLLKTLTVFRYAIENDYPAYGTYTFVIFCCWFNGITSMFGGLAGIAMGVSCICFGLFLSKYRREMYIVYQQVRRSLD